MEGRRTYLKRTGLILLGLSGLPAIASNGAVTKHQQTRPAMIIDVNRCMGCHSCVVACKAQNQTPKGFFNTRIATHNHGRFPSAWKAYTPELCHHCEDAPCIAACREGATYRLASGIVVVDWQHCKGDGACASACPYDAIFLDQLSGNKADKCDFCVPRLKQGLEPACVESCPSRARLFGDLANPQEEFAEHLAQIKIEQPDVQPGSTGRLFYTTAKKN